ncbi:MAG: ThuA domain-containing protein [Akkermansiaceae bacterium]|nr:ThuA domain-containing protein [Akkermansiaceae bacterium]
MKSIPAFLASLLFLLAGSLSQAAEPVRILFFSKSSGFEHPVISWKKGKPSYAENVLSGMAEKNNWSFEFSKDGSKFSDDYLKQFDTIIFYTSGDLTKKGRDKQPPMSKEGVQALFDYVRNGGGFIGLHCASDTFHTSGKGKHKELDKFGNNACPGEFIGMVGGEFIGHGPQQEATNRVINPKFPGYGKLGDSFTLFEEWYAMKNFNPDMHALTVIEPKGLKEKRRTVYNRPPYPTSWARMEDKGRVYYNAMGHREDVWDSELFQNMIIGAVDWTRGAVDVDIPANLEECAPDFRVLNSDDK